MPLPGNYETTVSLERPVEDALKKEQARRQLKTGKKQTINALASELLTTAILALGG